MIDKPRNQVYVMHKRYIFKRPIRYVLYIINGISLIYSIGDYDALMAPNAWKGQCIAFTIWVTTLVCMYFHTRIFE